MLINIFNDPYYQSLSEAGIDNFMCSLHNYIHTSLQVYAFPMSISTKWQANAEHETAPHLMKKKKKKNSYNGNYVLLKNSLIILLFIFLIKNGFLLLHIHFFLLYKK